jgi:flagellin-like hook-associated protein FlgL
MDIKSDSSVPMSAKLLKESSARLDQSISRLSSASRRVFAQGEGGGAASSGQTGSEPMVADPTIQQLNNAINQVNVDRTAVNANLSRLAGAAASSTEVPWSELAPESATDQVRMAEEGANRAQEAFLTQSTTSMLAQANISSRSALMLLG